MRGFEGAVLALALLPLAACAREFQERIPAAGSRGIEVNLDLGEGLRPDPGSLEITSHDAEEVLVVADASGWGAYGVTLRAARAGSTVRVDGRVQGPLTWLFGGPHLRVRVFVPRPFDVDAEASAGPIRIEDVRGRVRARTADARIEVRGAEGPVKLRTTDETVFLEDVAGDVDVRVDGGGIDLERIAGNVDLRTTRGAIELRHVVGAVLAKTGRGAIEIHDVAGPVEAKTEQGPIFASFVAGPAGSLETLSGPLEVIFRGDGGAELDARATRGAVEIGRGLETTGERTDSAVLARVNGGGPRLNLRTARGDIRLGAR